MQVLIGGMIIACNCLYHDFELGRFTILELDLMCLQNTNNLSNDNKMIDILTGQVSCRVKCPVSCCMARLKNLGNPLEWIQRALLEEKVKAKTDKPEDNIIIPGPPQQVGELSFSVTSAKFQERLVEWQLATAEENMKVNIKTGSSLHPNLTDYYCHRVN